MSAPTDDQKVGVHKDYILSFCAFSRECYEAGIEPKKRVRWGTIPALALKWGLSEKQVKRIVYEKRSGATRALRAAGLG